MSPSSKLRALMSSTMCALVTTAGASAVADTAETSTDAGLAAPVHRTDVVHAALARNPSYRAASERARATRLAAQGEGALPAPEAMAQVWQVPVARPWALDNALMIMLGVSQTFPAPGALGAREASKAEEAHADDAMAADRARVVVRDAEHAFVDYAEAFERHHVHLEHAVVAARVLDVARSRLQSGGPLTDVTQAEVEVARVRADASTDEARAAGARARLNALLARPADAPLGDPVLDPPGVPGLVAAAVVERAREQRPELRAARATRDARARELDAANAEAHWPSITVAALYFAPTMTMPASGYGANLSVSLPWLWGAAERKADAQRAYARAARDEVTAVQIGVEADVAGAEAAALASAARLRIVRDEALPASHRSFDAAWSAYTAGRADILTVLNAQRAVVDTELDVVLTRSALDHAMADLDAAAGFAVPRVPLPAEPTPSGGDANVRR